MGRSRTTNRSGGARPIPRKRSAGRSANGSGRSGCAPTPRSTGRSTQARDCARTGAALDDAADTEPAAIPRPQPRVDRPAWIRSGPGGSAQIGSRGPADRTAGCSGRLRIKCQGTSGGAPPPNRNSKDFPIASTVELPCSFGPCAKKDRLRVSNRSLVELGVSSDPDVSRTLAPRSLVGVCRSPVHQVLRASV